MKTWNDKDGNRLSLIDIFLFLNLTPLGHSRMLGYIQNRVWILRRLPEEVAKAEGHWHHIRGCWGINAQAVRLHEEIGFDSVEFFGFDSEGREYTIPRTVAEILREKSFQYEPFEEQFEFPKVVVNQLTLDL